ncbi:amidohydrolase family protein [Hoeflea sp. YIM 152468]|uniref:amidohydrolase family protein n=1 Tax=Hoeflea sp. YIM 152468 TaxID=3031759 RepID=UPI0023DC42F0|nr:amidohydrolase family protein [Hoeflea sp. YIM 152468]MDF1608911.1 amidohydrolase family protein [Hoeflea sp. YIM 152468]
MWCDSHVHVVAPESECSQTSGRTFLAEPAPLATLIEKGRPHGIDHFVITQPSFYGTDNSVLLKALDELNGRGSGVATAAPEMDAAELRKWRSRGVSGLRVNLYSPAAQNVGEGTDDLEAVGRLAADHGFHVEIIAPLSVLAARADVIAALGVPCVIDHYGLFGRVRPGDESGKVLLRLMAQDHLWIKLSSPYRHPDRPLNVNPDSEWLSGFLDVCPDRCVWGSDWPHPPPHDRHLGPDTVAPWRPLSYAALVESFVAALGCSTLISNIMWDNPARLYGFAPPA